LPAELNTTRRQAGAAVHVFKQIAGEID